MGGLAVIALIMTLNYALPIFGKQSDLVSKSRLAIADPDADPDLVWENMHSHGKIAAIEMAALWVQLLVISTWCMLSFQPNCNQTLCKLVTIIFLSWQPVWYLGMMGRIDDVNGPASTSLVGQGTSAAREGTDDQNVRGFKRDAMWYLKNETIMEVSLSVIFGYLGFFAPEPHMPSWQAQWDNLTGWDYGRMGAQGLVVLIMFFNYLPPIFGRQSDIVSVSRMAIGDPDADPDRVWSQLHSHGKIAAIEMAALWVQLMVIMNAGLVAFQPSCSKAFCKVLAIIFLSWQPVWYLAVVGKVDDKDGLQRDAMFIFKKETGQELFLAAIFIWLGFFAP